MRIFAPIALVASLGACAGFKEQAKVADGYHEVASSVKPPDPIDEILATACRKVALATLTMARDAQRVLVAADGDVTKETEAAVDVATTLTRGVCKLAGIQPGAAYRPRMPPVPAVPDVTVPAGGPAPPTPAAPAQPPGGPAPPVPPAAPPPGPPTPPAPPSAPAPPAVPPAPGAG